MRISIYRFNPDRQAKPRQQTYDVTPQHNDRMLLDLLVRLKTQDDSLSYRRFCREGICGSDGM